VPRERTQIVEAYDVVAVGVGDEDGIEFVEFGAQALFAKIGAAIDKPLFAVGCLDVDGASFALVTRVVGGANFAIAADHRNADRSAGSKKSDFHSCHW